jgi:hypothetical protein
MDLFEKIVEDPFFFRWIFNPDKETELYWRTYMKANPEDANLVKELKAKASYYFGHSREKLSIQEKEQLSLQIKQRLALEEQKDKRKRYLFSFMKYAAVALLFSIVSSTLVYFQMRQNDTNLYVQDIPFTAQIHEPTLIFSGRENIRLNSSKSTLDYSQTGKIVLNGDSVIQSKKAGSDQNPAINQLVIPYGNRSKITLSDGTTVWLNAGSRLVYPSVFVEKTREVLLFGEAFFEVTENKDRPFVVKTSALAVKVLGTSFNVSAYPDDKTIQTVLEEGSVAIRKNGAQFFENDIILKPNQLASFNKGTNESKIYDVDTEYYTVWTEGLLSFDEVDLSRIIKKVERYYNVEMIYTDPALGATKITGKLDLNQNTDEVFEYIGKVSLTTIEKISNNLYKIKKTGKW